MEGLPSTKDSSPPAATPSLDIKNYNIDEDIRSLLSDIHSRLPTKEEITDFSQHVRAIHDPKSIPSQFIWNAALQIVCVITAFEFGVFSIFSWHGQFNSNAMSVQAIQLALISLCFSSNNVRATPHSSN
jgi:hypothetical protein